MLYQSKNDLQHWTSAGLARWQLSTLKNDLIGTIAATCISPPSPPMSAKCGEGCVPELLLRLDAPLRVPASWEGSGLSGTSSRFRAKANTWIKMLGEIMRVIDSSPEIYKVYEWIHWRHTCLQSALEDKTKEQEGRKKHPFIAPVFTNPTWSPV